MVFRKLVGAEVKRKEDPRLITGRGTYTANLRLPGMKHLTFVRSPYAHARIGSIDAAAARSIPGVAAVISGEDLKSAYRMLSVDGGNPQHSRYALAVGRVRHVGEAAVAVIADSPDIAFDAAAAVMIDWQPLPVVATLQQAMAADAPPIYEDMTHNILDTSHHLEGDVESAFAQADHVIKQRIVSQRLAAVPMEPRAVVAAPDPTNGGLTLWSSTQTPHGIRGELAKQLGLTENLVRVIAPDVGGGFGVKIGLYPEELALAALALRLQMPLCWTEDRSENLLATTHGRAQITELELAVQQDGKVSALRIDVTGDVGAYPIFTFLPWLTGRMSVGVYHIPAVEINTRCICTNTTPVAAYRGAGRPEAAYYIERLMDIAALELGIDPVEIRRKNLIPPDAFPYQTPTGATYDSGEYERALDKALEMAGYADLRAKQAQRNGDGEMLMGIGVAVFVETCAPGPYESASVRVEPSGSVTVFTGIMPHGQGQGTTFAQMVADEIGADYDRIVVKYGDTASGPMGIGTYGSRGLAVGGMALMRSTEQIRAKAQQIAAHILEAAEEDIVLENGLYQVRGMPAKGLSLTQIAQRAYSGNLPDHITSGLESTDFFRPKGDGVYPFGAHVAVVEVERETGIVHLRDYISVEDCGPRISPLLVEGQVHGGLAQGIGQALWEEMVYDEHGQLLTGTLMDYAMPRIDSFPWFRTGSTETPTPLNPMGVKGVGEAATIGSTPAVVNAVMDALKSFGVQHIDMPLRPEKLWRAMNGE